MGAKIHLNGTSKVNRLTHIQTHRQTDIWTFGLLESIGPEAQCFENAVCIWISSKEGGCVMQPGGL